MRPTIPLWDWRIAVDLDASKGLRRQAGHPAEGCECPACTMWRSVAHKVFPPLIASELARLGIDPARPSDLYVTGETGEGRDMRVLYHVAGKLLSGPAPWLESVPGKMHNYSVVQTEPTWIGLRVSSAKDSFEWAPELPEGTSSNVLCIDFRLQVAALRSRLG